MFKLNSIKNKIDNKAYSTRTKVVAKISDKTWYKGRNIFHQQQLYAQVYNQVCNQLLGEKYDSQ